MSLFIESIRIEDGNPCLLVHHERRVARTLLKFFPTRHWKLSEMLKGTRFPMEGIHKCRVVYGAQPISIEVESYKIRPLNSLKLVNGDGIDYRYKYVDRAEIERLYDLRGEKDDVLIVQNGFLTDTSFGNIALMNEREEWITPRSYLLAGTMRQHLVESGRVFEEDVPVDALRSYRKFKVINALRGWDTIASDVSNIDYFEG